MMFESRRNLGNGFQVEQGMPPDVGGCLQAAMFPSVIQIDPSDTPCLRDRLSTGTQSDRNKPNLR